MPTHAGISSLTQVTEQRSGEDNTSNALQAVALLSLDAANTSTVICINRQCFGRKDALYLGQYKSHIFIIIYLLTCDFVHFSMSSGTFINLSGTLKSPFGFLAVDILRL